MIKMGKKGKKEKPIEYNLVVTRYGAGIPITVKYIGPVPEGKSLWEVWNTSVKEFAGENFVELDKQFLSADVLGSNYVIEMAFVETNGYYERHTGPMMDIKAAGFHRCQASVASIIDRIKDYNSAKSSSGLVVLKDTSGGYYINDAAMEIISDLENEHEPKHLKGDQDHKDNYFVVGDHCFNAKSCKNYYEYMEALIGPRPWMVE